MFKITSKYLTAPFVALALVACNKATPVISNDPSNATPASKLSISTINGNSSNGPQKLLVREKLAFDVKSNSTQKLNVRVITQ
jgi:hypothetical protein